jgi:hypothetical protein
MEHGGGRNKKIDSEFLGKILSNKSPSNLTFNSKQLNIFKKGKKRSEIRSAVKIRQTDGSEIKWRHFYLLAFEADGAAKSETRCDPNYFQSGHKKIIYNFVYISACWKRAGGRLWVGDSRQNDGGRTNKNPSACFRWCRSHFPSPTVDLGVFWT